MSNIEAPAAKIIELGEKMAAPAADLAMAAARVQAYTSAIGGVVCLVVAGWLAVAALTLFRKAQSLADANDRYGADTSDYWQFFAALIAGFFAAMFGIAAAVNLLDPWTYIAMQRPELWLAKKALGP